MLSWLQAGLGQPFREGVWGWHRARVSSIGAGWFCGKIRASGGGDNPASVGC